jgi:hypothetical protein
MLVLATTNHRDGGDADGAVPGRGWTNNRLINPTRNQRNPSAIPATIHVNRDGPDPANSAMKLPIRTNHRGQGRDAVGAADAVAKNPIVTDLIPDRRNRKHATMIKAVLGAGGPGAAVLPALTIRHAKLPAETISIVMMLKWAASPAVYWIQIWMIVKSVVRVHKMTMTAMNRPAQDAGADADAVAGADALAKKGLPMHQTNDPEPKVPVRTIPMMIH